MERRIRRQPRALADVEELAVYVGLEAPVDALRFLDAVEATLLLLSACPELGTTREFGRSELSGLRSFCVQGFNRHLIVYRPTQVGIEVVRVLREARDLGAILDESPMQDG